MESEVRQQVIKMLEDFSENGSQVKDLSYDEELTVLGINSVTFMRLVVAAEMEFDIEWDDEDLDFSDFSTINNITNYILKSNPKI